MSTPGLSSRLTSLAGRLLGAVRPAPAPDLFGRLCGAYERRLRRWPLPQATGPGPRMAVLITPWLSTAVPLLTLECAAMLARAGGDVTLLTDFANVVGNSAEPAHEDALRRLCDQFPPAFRRADPSTLAPDPQAGDLAAATKIAHMNAVRVTWGESTVDQFFAQYPRAIEEVAAHFGRVRRLLREGQFTSIFMPGGIYGLSAIYVAVARELGLPFSTFDGGARTLRLTQNGVAAQLADVPAAQGVVETEASPTELAQARAIASEELTLRLERRDLRQYQAAVATGAPAGRTDVLVPLNVIWDTAAIGRQHLFATCAEWLEAVCQWAAGRPEVSVCVRQHPRERLHPWKTSDDPQALVARYSHLGPRLRFIASGDPVSTYDLLQGARVVLPHTSTVGVEAAMLGKPVVLASRCYYEELGFALRVASQAEYFIRVEEALLGQHAPTLAQRERAALNYYLTQRCSWISTCFTGVPDDFYEWVEIPPETLWAEPGLQDFRTALLHAEFLAVARHRRSRLSGNS